MDDIIILTKKDLVNILSDASRAAVGKLMKRFDLHLDREILKSECKETIYESYRDIKVQLECYSKGLQYYNVDLQRPNSKKE
jgi:hypothetical protein